MILKKIILMIRSFKRDKTFLSINLFGMVMGLLVALLTGFYIFYQLSYEKFVTDYDQIYRLEYIVTEQGNEWHKATASPSLARVMKEEIPGIRDVIILHYTGLNIQFECDGKPVAMGEWMMTTKNYLEYYNAEFIYGNLAKFNTTNGLIISESFANKYFPDEDPVGKVLMVPGNNFERFIVEGVIKDIPPNTHIRVDAFATNSTEWSNRDPIDDYNAENLIMGYQYVYLVLEDNVDIADILKQYPDIKEKYLSKHLEERGIDIEITATPLWKIHFTQGLLGDRPTENMNSVYFFLIIAAVVVILSIINFVNLSLARQVERNVDIGIRKTFGATKAEIFFQYLSETFFFLLICFIISLALFHFVKPAFAQFNGLDLVDAKFNNLGYWIIIPFFLIITFMAGFYPAYTVAGKKPILIMKGRSGKVKKFSRQIFVTVQIILSILFFFTTNVVYLQMKYVKSTDKGYNLENVIAYEYYNFGDDVPSCADICERLEKSAYINETAVSTKLPGQELFKSLILADLQEGEVQTESYFYNIDEDYLDFMHISILKGRNFDKNMTTDSSKVIVNEAFVRSIGSPENILGTRIYLKENAYESGVGIDSEIIGVCKDYHMHSLHQKIAPLVLTHIPYAPNFYHIKYKSKNAKDVITHADKVFDDLASKYILCAKKYFPEEEILRQYEVEEHLSQMTIWLAGLSILLAMLGVFGLTAFMIRYNIKALCVRKVLGAEQKDLFIYLIKDYVVVLLLSNLIALPVAWYVSTKWLERFAYQISFSVWMFIAASLMSVMIILITIIYHVLVLDKTNPAIYLQDE